MLKGGLLHLIFQLRDGSASQRYWTACVFLSFPPPAIVRHRLLCTFTSRNVVASTGVKRQRREGSLSQAYWTETVFSAVPPPAMVRQRLLLKCLICTMSSFTIVKLQKR